MTGLVGLGLLENLSSAGSTASWGGELAHIFTVALSLFLLGVDARSEQRSGRHGAHGRDWGESLKLKD